MTEPLDPLALRNLADDLCRCGDPTGRIIHELLDENQRLIVQVPAMQTHLTRVLHWLDHSDTDELDEDEVDALRATLAQIAPKP